MEPTEPITVDSAEPAPKPTQPSRRPKLRRALAVAAGVAMVPALYAVSNAATGGGASPSTVSAASRAADDHGVDAGAETEIEHGVVVEKPHGGATTPSVPESALIAPRATTPTTPEATSPTTPEQEIEHPVPEPGDDNGVDAPGDDHGNDDGAVAPVPSGTQAFSSVGGSIVVAVNGSSISLASSSPAAGFGAEVQDNGPTRVEVRFTNGGTEWRIRIELGAGGLTSEITQHG
jgi:hypothetical protein